MKNVGESLLRNDERLSELSWPALQSVQTPGLREGDALVVCGGFEDRAGSVLNRACCSGDTGFEILLIDYEPRYAQNRTEELMDVARRSGVAPLEYKYDRSSPAGAGVDVVRLLREVKRVFVDISGMSRLLIVQSIVALLTMTTMPVIILYTEAEQYSPNEKEFEAKRKTEMHRPVSFLSSGILEVAATPELASVAMVGEAVRLIGFPSFDPTQMINVVQEVQPTFLDVIEGRPPADQNRWREGAIWTLNEPFLQGQNGLNRYVTSTLDYRETMSVVLEIYGKRSAFDRFLISPTGSKMQTVAMALLRAAMPDLQVVYPTPHIFTKPDNYTKGARQIYRLDVPMDMWLDR